MEIEQKNRLTETEKAEITGLIDRCNAFDQTELGIYLDNGFNFYPEMDCFFLASEGGELVGFLNAYAGEPDDAKIKGCVLPEARRRGIFKSLYARAKQELDRFGYAHIQLVSQKSFLDRNPVMSAFHATLHSEEYHMKYNPEAACRAFTPDPELVLRAVEEPDVEAVSRVTARAFGGSPEVEQNYARNACRSEHLMPYILLRGEEILASATVDLSGKGRYLYGLCVDPDRQRKGYGAYLVLELVRRLRAESDAEIALAVDSENPAALQLYRSCGFEITSTEQYFRVEDAAQ